MTQLRRSRARNTLKNAIMATYGALILALLQIVLMLITHQLIFLVSTGLALGLAVVLLTVAARTALMLLAEEN